MVPIRYSVYILQERCIGCGTCETMKPIFFKINSSGKANIKGLPRCSIGIKDVESIKEVVDSCPVQAIRMKIK